MVLPKGTYLVECPLELPNKVSLALEPGAEVRATVAMDYLLRTPMGKATEPPVRDQSISGGVWNANGLANDGLVLAYFANFTLRDCVVRRAQWYGIILGETEAYGTSSEAMLYNVSVDRIGGGPMKASSIGIWLRRAADSHSRRDLRLQRFG